MKTSELKKLLKKNGIEFIAHGSNHDIYRSPITNKTFTVPRHAKEIKTGTLNSILKQAGIKKGGN